MKIKTDVNYVTTSSIPLWMNKFNTASSVGFLLSPLLTPKHKLFPIFTGLSLLSSLALGKSWKYLESNKFLKSEFFKKFLR